MGCGDVVSLDGAGTSAATPQAAAAAALWLLRNPPLAGIQPWRRVDAVRHAMFSSADKTPNDRLTYFGQGLLRARAALNVPFDATLPKIPRDSVGFLLLRALAGFDRLPAPRARMLEVEAAQLAVTSPRITAVLPDPDTPLERISISDRRRVVRALQAHPSASDSLRRFLTTATL
jgi:hypothetical protein